jgi:hypothetical protein
MAERKGISAGVAAQCIGDITGRREIPNSNKYRETRNGRESCDSAKYASATPYPVSTRGHGGAQQQRERWVAGHGIVFLRSGEGEKDEEKTGPAKGEETCSTRAVNGFVRKLRNRREINTPWKEPKEVKKPKPESWNGIVVARIAQIQEAKKLFVDEIKPEEAVVLTGPAV